MTELTDERIDEINEAALGVCNDLAQHCANDDELIQAFTALFVFASKCVTGLMGHEYKRDLLHSALNDHDSIRIVKGGLQ